MKPTVVSMFGHWEARVRDGRRTIAACRHAHRTSLAAQKCAEKMARRAGWIPLRLFGVMTEKFGLLYREDTSLPAATDWAMKAFGRDDVKWVRKERLESRP